MNRDLEKQRAAEAAIELVQPGMLLGLGTGSTAAFVLKLLGQRVRGGLKIRGVPTSRATAELAQQEGIPLIGFADAVELDLTLDGADEIAPDLSLIKGGGGALFREKIVAAASRRVVILADASKRVPRLGKFPLPVEVNPFGWQVVAARIEALGAKVTLRQARGQPFLTDNQGHVLDCAFGSIADPAQLEGRLRRIVGVMETGLFVNLAHQAIIADGDAIVRLAR